MAIRLYKAFTPGTRNRTVSTFEEINTNRPEKSLIKKIHYCKGRNNKGLITSRHRGGGHKKKYRIIDFKRKKTNILAKVASIEYDPNRNARIALLHYTDGSKKYILHPRSLKIGQHINSGPNASIEVGNAMPLSNIPLGTAVHNIEITPGKGGQIVRAAGTYAQLIDHNNITIGKAGRNRWLGKKPHVRGIAMNPVDHPHGGGEGRSPIGRKYPVTPWGKPTLGVKTRAAKKYSNSYILRRRK